MENSEAMLYAGDITLDVKVVAKLAKSGTVDRVTTQVGVMVISAELCVGPIIYSHTFSSWSGVLVCL